MKILTHPTFLGKWKRVFAATFVYFLATVSGVIYLGKHGFESFATAALWFVLASNALMFAVLGALPFFVTCANCRGKTVTKSSREECPDYWSAHCKSCDVVWNLGLGNSD